MKIIISCSLLLLVQFSFGQSTFIQGKGFRGNIFDTTTFILKSINEQKARYYLTAADIKKAEHLLKIKLEFLNKTKVNQVGGCPVIHRKLKKFHRQYVGFVNKRGELIVWINLFWDKDLVERAKSEIIRVNDGCSYYWNIEVNITSEKLQNLDVNGKG